MDPNLIMGDSQKRERFRHYYKKKDEAERLKHEQLQLEREAENARLRVYPRPILPKYGFHLDFNGSVHFQRLD